jgi:hypothetical protein
MAAITPMPNISLSDETSAAGTFSFTLKGRQSLSWPPPQPASISSGS